MTFACYYPHIFTSSLFCAYSLRSMCAARLRWCVPVGQQCSSVLAAGPVKGLAVTPDGDAVVSCSTDCSVRLFRLPFAPFAPGPVQDSAGAVLEFQGRHAIRGVDHHWTDSKFATAGAQVQHPAGTSDCREAGCGADRVQRCCRTIRSLSSIKSGVWNMTLLQVRSPANDPYASSSVLQLSPSAD